MQKCLHPYISDFTTVAPKCSFIKSEKKPPFFLSLDENEKLCCWGSQQTLVSTFRNEDEDARTNGAFRFLLRFKRQNTSNFLYCRRRRQPFFNVRLYVSEMSKFWWLTKTISLFKLEQVWRKCHINGILGVPIYIIKVCTAILSQQGQTILWSLRTLQIFFFCC